MISGTQEIPKEKCRKNVPNISNVIMQFSGLEFSEYREIGNFPLIPMRDTVGVVHADYDL